MNSITVPPKFKIRDYSSWVCLYCALFEIVAGNVRGTCKDGGVLMRSMVEVGLAAHWHGLSFRTIARNVNVSLGTVSNIISLFERTGDVETKQPRPRPHLHKLDEGDEFSIIGTVMQHPNMHLLEICKEIELLSGVSVSPSTICRLLKRYNFSRKKLQFIATERNPNYASKESSLVATPLPGVQLPLVYPKGPFSVLFCF